MSTQVKKTISILMFATVCLVFGGIVNQRAEASVCFLPDDSMCDEEGVSSTKDYGFWPGGSGNGKTTSSCDSSYNRSYGGANCKQCTDKTSRYYGYYKCSETCGDEYNSDQSENACGRCEKCLIAGDKNYGKYKCPEDCDSCADYTDELPADYNDPNACQAKVCEACPTDNTKYKCTDRTEVCDVNVYTVQPSYYNSLTTKQKENHCYGTCDLCYDELNGYGHCDCLGYDTRAGGCDTGYQPYNECNGKGGTWYEGCCNKCEGYNYSSIKTGNGWSCTKCENACGEEEKWKCICTPVTCTAVTIPENAHGTTKCKTRNEACQEGEEVYTAWECDTDAGYFNNNGKCEKPANDCTRFTYFWVNNSYSDFLHISVTGFDKKFFPKSTEYPAYKVCENATVTLSVIDNLNLCKLTVDNWYFSGYNGNINKTSGNYGSGKNLTFTVTDDFVNEFLNDVGWLTEEDEGIATNQYIQPDIEYQGYSSSGTCYAATGKTCSQDNSTGCYTPNTKATIYCSYDDMLQTGNGCWRDSSWFETPCASDNELFPCEVDYYVIANNDTTGTTICDGAQKAKNHKLGGLYAYGPTSLAAGTYRLYVSYTGAIGFDTSHSSMYMNNGIRYKHWVPDVMLVMNDRDINSFQCYNIAYSGATQNTCSVGDSRNVRQLLSYTKLDNWVDSDAYANASSTTVSCPYFSDSITSNAQYTFEAGKTYYIHVGSSGTGTGAGCTSAWGCGYRLDY